MQDNDVVVLNNLRNASEKALDREHQKSQENQ